jgi:hypothetical protein
VAVFDQHSPRPRAASIDDRESLASEVIGSSPECAVATIGPCVVLLWRRAVVMQGTEWIRKALFAVARSHAKEKVAFLTVLESACELSTPTDVRHKIADLLNQNQDRLAAAAITFEGRGFRMTVVRSIITAIHVASRSRFPNSVFSDVQTSTDWLERRGALGPALGAADVVKVVDLLRVL